MSRSPRIIAPLAVAAVALAALVGFRPMLAPRPPVVAAVRMEPLFEGLHQRGQAKAEIEEMEQEIRGEHSRRQAQIAAIEERLASAAGQIKRREIQDELDLAKLRANFWFQAATQQLEIEKAIRLQALYRDIKLALQDLAEAQGYDLVVLNDEIDQPLYDREARISPQMQVLQQITSTHTLYLNASLDVTDDLIQRMNNAFRASQAGP